MADELARRPRRRSILVAEDHAGVRTVITDFLQCEGYDVFAARSGLDVLHILVQEHLPDLVLLDLAMPYLDGRMVMNVIRRHHPRLPVVIVSGAFCTPAELVEMGATGYLPKPFTTTELLDSIGRALPVEQVAVV